MTYWFVLTMFFILGLVIGSFINAFEYRIDSDLSVVKGRSICPKCKKQLAWYDNIPVISFMVLGGKCRYCKKPISWQYPIVELLTGFGFVAVAVKVLNSVIPDLFRNLVSNAQIPAFAGMTKWDVGMTTDFIVRGSAANGELVPGVISLLCLFFITFCLILVALHDQKTTYVLSGYVYAAILATAVYLLVTYIGGWGLKEVGAYLLPNVLAAIVAMTPFAVLYIFSKGAWMGAGDIEIAALLGFLLGWPNFFIALYFAFIVGSIWGLVKVYLLKKANLKSEIPFAPFLIAGTFFAFIFAEQLVSVYVKIFLG